ncbi:hypothetical protein DsansV1_C32g0221501 [Dioscorea sansibarensis]
MVSEDKETSSPAIQVASQPRSPIFSVASALLNLSRRSSSPGPSSSPLLLCFPKPFILFSIFSDLATRYGCLSLRFSPQMNRPKIGYLPPFGALDYHLWPWKREV